MKSFSALLLVACIALAQSKGITNEDKAKFKIFKQECITETHVDKAILKKAKTEGDFADDKNLKHFIVCLFKKIEFLNKDGKLDKKSFKEILMKKYEDDVAGKIFNACAKQQDDVNESAFEMAKCYHKHAPYINID